MIPHILWGCDSFTSNKYVLLAGFVWKFKKNFCKIFFFFVHDGSIILYIQSIYSYIWIDNVLSFSVYFLMYLDYTHSK